MHQCSLRGEYLHPIAGGTLDGGPRQCHRAKLAAHGHELDPGALVGLAQRGGQQGPPGRGRRLALLHTHPLAWAHRLGDVLGGHAHGGARVDGDGGGALRIHRHLEGGAAGHGLGQQPRGPIGGLGRGEVVGGLEVCLGLPELRRGFLASGGLGVRLGQGQARRRQRVERLGAVRFGRQLEHGAWGDGIGGQPVEGLQLAGALGVSQETLRELGQRLALAHHHLGGRGGGTEVGHEEECVSHWKTISRPAWMVAEGVETESAWVAGASSVASTFPLSTVTSVRVCPGRGRVSAMPMSASSPRFTEPPWAKTMRACAPPAVLTLSFSKRGSPSRAASHSSPEARLSFTSPLTSLRWAWGGRTGGGGGDACGFPSGLQPAGRAESARAMSMEVQRPFTSGFRGRSLAGVRPRSHAQGGAPASPAGGGVRGRGGFGGCAAGGPCPPGPGPAPRPPRRGR
ncbi:hypothetical protein STIAU_6176 [Stigmatella aurantiaca DW4/3-1]|uniref:Uncharacterized protein n=1 Tax=Stigmatella aurantiaca (strain DW4/3-1) TaxID=378806 RepID=Q09BT6_STIAD|nr:hypothetical protein STIAU_6176 [Stigmatella aurantiaca DW4/3-1]